MMFVYLGSHCDECLSCSLLLHKIEQGLGAMKQERGSIMGVHTDREIVRKRS